MAKLYHLNFQFAKYQPTNLQVLPLVTYNLQLIYQKRGPTNLQLFHFQSCRFYNPKQPNSTAYSMSPPSIVKPGIKKLAIHRSKELNKCKRSRMNCMLLKQSFFTKKLHAGNSSKLVQLKQIHQGTDYRTTPV